MLHRVAIFSKDNNAKTREGVQTLIDEFFKRGIEILLYQRPHSGDSYYTAEKIEFFNDISSLSGPPDMILSVGGDGTFLETVLKVKDLGIPVAGVNTGRMGFLANIPNEEIGKSIDLLCNNEFEVIERSMLEISRPAGLFEDEPATALNEITIQKGSMSMITIHVYINGGFLNTYWADGLIISTATGSTAYNLSVGGPILSPEDESIIISPISPHNLTIRPIVLSGESSLKMMLEARTNEFLATCDFRFRRLPVEEEINIIRSNTRLKTVMLKGRDFYSTLRNRLMWGMDKRN
ncbi:MAG: NAD(+)/NADH kinase [Bacteroidales bacterium]|nr:NAD(+)/NADH kinase [Bacteroidales bacterium]